jgi:dephospho-CoA kinase
MQRDLVTREFAESQLAAQMSLDEKRLHATRIFDNTGTLDHLYAQVDTALSDLRKTLTIN